MINERLNVVIADDHHVFRVGMETVLKQMDMVSSIYAASNGEEVLQILSKTDVDLVFMDISMPVMNGVEATRIIRQKFDPVKVFALSMFNDKCSILKMLGAGASGYMTKDVSPDEIREALMNCIRNKKYYSKSILYMMLDEIDDAIGNGRKVMHKEKLTRREIEVIGMVSQGLTSKEIGMQMHITTKTVESHRSHIFEKLKIKRVIDLFNYSRINGSNGIGE